MKLNLIQRRRLMLPALLIAALLGNLIVSTSRAAMTAPGTATAVAATTDGWVIGWGRNIQGEVNIPTAARSGVTAWQDRADANPWQDIAQTQFNRLAGARSISPVKSRGLRLNRAALAEQLTQAPVERMPEAVARPLLLPLPYPDGTFKTFRVVESPIMEPGLAEKFPDIKTYFADSPEDPAARVRFDLTPQGFHAMILSDKPTILIDPPIEGNAEYYLSYYKGDLPQTREAWDCDVKQEISPEPSPQGSFAPDVSNGATLRAYRLAVAATGEYTAAHGGTVASALSAVTTTFNRVNAVFERDLATRLTLVANNDQIIYTNAATDPYPLATLGQNQINLDNVIGTANYDIGHLLTFGRGGVAGPGVVCVSGSKALGLTAVSTPADDLIVAHEIGHQFGALHSFNGSSGTCGDNRTYQGAYEPGSGSTIMAYAGNCGSENLQAGADDYFHVISLEEITGNIANRLCAARTATGNALPTVSAGNSFTIPIQTPFTLTAAGSDPNGDALTYCWEQYNLGAAAPPNTDNGNRPIFRSFPPTLDPARTFPRWGDILNNTTTLGESLPTTTRTLTFQVTARDNHAGGGAINSATVNIATTDTAGPFRVTSPNTAVTWAIGAAQTVTWDVANTDLSPVNCANVKIKLSIDGGLSFPFTLLDSAPNTGSAEVIAPLVATTQARIKVEAADNIFFDVSNANFSLVCPAVTGAVAGGDVICAGGTANVTVTVSGGAAPYTVKLNTDEMQTGDGPVFTFPVSPALNTSYSLSAGSQDANGCAITGSGSATVTVNPIPAMPTITPGGPTTFCVGGSVTLTSSSATGNQWYLNGNPIGGATSQTYSATAPGNYTVIVTANSCSSAASSARVVTVNPLPAVTLGANPFVSQGTTTANLNYTATGSPNQYSIDYGAAANNAGFADVANAALPASPIVLTMPGTAAGAYNATLTVRNSATGCVSSAHSFTVNINAPPVARCRNVTVSAGASCTASVTAVQINNGSSDPDGNPISLSLNSYGPFGLGAHTIMLTVTDSYGASSSCSAVVTVTDNTTPTLTLKPDIQLWPPDHMYRTLTMSQMVQGVSDACNAALSLNDVKIEKVTSDEPDNAAGNADGNTTNDIVIAANCQSVQLRSERDERKNGRVYSVTLRVRDTSGNTTREVFKVSVPINQSGAAAVPEAAALTKTSGCP